MYYCENCHLLCEWPVCGYCGTRPLREPRADDYCFLSSRNEPWAQMLAELLQEERIAVVTRPVPQRGFGYSGGAQRLYGAVCALPGAGTREGAGTGAADERTVLPGGRGRVCVRSSGKITKQAS